MTEDVNLDLLAASLRADASDLDAFVEGLAVKLEQALPGSVHVYRWRTRMLGPKVVRRIRIDAGDRRLELRAGDGSIETLCSRTSSGIVLKTEAVDVDTWLDALGQALAREAERSEKTRQALERLLIR
ncbi:MAG: hypothetical protein JOZ98_23905 [Solirubrobacterales bacterium]|nr:hypothetical protein [Solirubrobacterales bacterium]